MIKARFIRLTNHSSPITWERGPYGRGCGVGRDLGVTLGVAVGVGLAVGVDVGVGVTVGVGVGVGPDCAQYIPPVLKSVLPPLLVPPHTIISLPAQTAA